VNDPAGNQAKNWSAYWQKDGTGGEVFVGSGGEGNAEIAAFWRALFSEPGVGANIIDIACGAGSVFQHAQQPDQFELIGTDVSIDALRLLRQRSPGTGVVLASSSALPFKDSSFDLVVSQFGVEYAGTAAFGHALRLLKPGGRLCTLSHIRDGYIDRKNAVLQAGVRKAEELEFLAVARGLTQAAFSGVGVEEAVRRFQPAEREMAMFVAGNPGGFHGHLYSGFRQLFERRAHYDESDILGWLDGMVAEQSLNRLRLDEMRGAALDQAAIEEIQSLATQCGVSLSVSQMTLAGQSLPVAWQIVGRKE
jgi:SAM-dependent methyltransferase